MRSLSTVLPPQTAVAGSVTRNADAVVASLSSAGQLHAERHVHGHGKDGTARGGGEDGVGRFRRRH